MAKNMVIAGEYIGKPISAFSGNAQITIGRKNIIFLNGNSVRNYEVITEDIAKSAASGAARGIVGGALLGPVGMMAGAISAKSKGTHTLAIEFVDGKRSLIEVDDLIYKAIVAGTFCNAGATQAKRQCPNCGREIGTAKFCPECGTAIPEPEPSSPRVASRTTPSSGSISESGVVRRKELKKKKKSSILVAILAFFVLGAIVTVLFGGTEQGDKEVKLAFDATRFLVDDGGTQRPMTEAELIAEIGEPQSVEEWSYQVIDKEAPVRTLSYHDGKYIYDFNNDKLARIEIHVPVSFDDKKDIPEMYNLSGGTVFADTTAAYRVYDCGVHDLWVLYNDDGTKIDLAYISYTSFFEDLGSATTH